MEDELDTGMEPAVLSCGGKRNLRQPFSSCKRATSVGCTWKIFASRPQNWSGVELSLTAPCSVVIADAMAAVSSGSVPRFLLARCIFDRTPGGLRLPHKLLHGV